MYARNQKELADMLGVSEQMTNKFLRMTNFPQKITTPSGKRYEVLECLKWIAANPKAYGHYNRYFDKYRQEEFQNENDVDQTQKLRKEQTELTRIKKERLAVQLEKDKLRFVDLEKVQEDWATMFAIVRRRVFEIARHASGKVLACENADQSAKAIEDSINDTFSRIQVDFINLNRRHELTEEEIEKQLEDDDQDLITQDDVVVLDDEENIDEY